MRCHCCTDPYQTPYYLGNPYYWFYTNGTVVNNPYQPYHISYQNGETIFKDAGGQPYVININETAKQNNTFRTALWTGQHLQVTIMSLEISEDIGLEIHHDVDQFLRIEQGQGITRMGESKDQLSYVRQVNEDSAIFIPAGTWHNLTNTGNLPLKLYSIYAPPNHRFGTVHQTKEEAMVAEEEHDHNG